MKFLISPDKFNPAKFALELTDIRAGAHVTFEGRVRNLNDGHPVIALEYEAYAPLAEKEGARILAEAKDRFPLFAATGVHRVGALQLGDLAIWVGVTAAHRGAAFDACRFIIDEAKSRLPIWKKEHYADGATAWINCATHGEHASDSAPPAAR